MNTTNRLFFKAIRKIILLAFCMLMGGVGYAQYYVNDASIVGDVFGAGIGNDANPGTLTDPFATIQHAINTVPLGSTIYVETGNYNERVTINKKLTLIGASESGAIIDGTGLVGNGSGIKINNGVQDVVINYFTIQNFSGNSPNQYAGIYAVGGNDGIEVQHCTIKNNVGGSGFYANGPVDGVFLNDLEVFGHTNVSGAARGIVIWNGLKSNITITNCEVYNNNCCGIELQDGTATGVTMTGNNVHDNGDNGFGLTGMQGPGVNDISLNTVTDNGRFGIEIKNPNGSGASSGAGSIVVSDNTVTRTGSIGSELRDIAAISVYRRGVLMGNVDVPAGVWVENNTVSGYTQSSNSDGFGIVAEGLNHTIKNNTVSNCDVGIQKQSGHTPYPGDGDQSNLTDNYFGRGNSPVTCNITVVGNSFSGNTTDTRDVGSTNGAMASNLRTGKSFCSITGAINDAQTANGDTISLSSGVFVENVKINKGVAVIGQGQGQTIIYPALSDPTTGPGSWGGSNVIEVAANNVLIEALTVNGDNPNITSGVVVGGADIDARNGIINNYNLGTWSNLEVSHCEVKNIYFRGVYMATGLSFNFHDNVVTNVQGDPGGQSGGMMNFGGSGYYSNNTLSYTSSAIMSNHSTGTMYYGNYISNSSSGIHSDNNGDSGGYADSIINNTVVNSTAGGWGIWVFAPYRNVVVQGNTVQNVDVGMAVTGAMTVNVEVLFSDNLIDAQNKPSSYGFYATTSLFGWGSANNKTRFINNYVVNNTVGMDIEAEAGYTVNIAVNDNAIYNNSLSNVAREGTGTHTQNFQCNWWGMPNGSGEVGDALNYTPWRIDGTDAQPGDVGFQPASVCNQVCDVPNPNNLVFTGPKNVCPYLGTNEQITYTLSSVDASGYNWTLPPNMNLIAGGNGFDYITVTFNTQFGSQANKQIRVKPFNDCGIGAMKVFYLLTQAPSTPDPITISSDDVCAVIGTNNTITYSIPKTTAATSYIWTAQAGTTTINHPYGPGVNDTLVTVEFSNSFTTSSITVRAVNGCGVSGARSYLVVKANPSVPEPINGPSNVCEFIAPNGVAASYFVDQPATVSSYTWTVPPGSQNLTGQGTNSISFMYPNGFTGGTVSVTATNGCGTSGSRSYYVEPLYPGAPSFIDGIPVEENCPNREYTYSLTGMPVQATGLLWTIPAGGTITDGDGTPTITVSYDQSAISGQVTVKAISNCGVSPLRSMKVKFPECDNGQRVIPNPASQYTDHGIVITDEFSVLIFPNPAINEFGVKVNSIDKSSKIIVRIIDLQGREVGRVQASADNLQTIGSNLKRGVYMVEVIQGKNRSVQKLIKL